MTQFTIHTDATAPETAKPMLAAVQNKNGFTPNILAAMADAPNVLKGYLDLAGNCAQGTLSATEQQVIEITASRLNGCEYCVAAHSYFSEKQNVAADVLEAARQGTAIADAKLETLRQFTATMVEKEGWASEADVQTMLTAGYTRGQVLETILCMTLKYLTNTVNHVVKTPLDASFAPKQISLSDACCGGGCHSQKMAS